jgi:hypothetical protein
MQALLGEWGIKKLYWHHCSIINIFKEYFKTIQKVWKYLTKVKITAVKTKKVSR